tara:strand:+ start:387 stop:1004 length:618 start_codon:yes stop_codon:yes gene_type:complete
MKPKYWNKGKIYLSKNDKVLKNLINNFPKESLKLNPNYYHALLNSIIGQQISVAAANSVKQKFFKLDKNMTPKKLLNFENKTLKMTGLSKQKTQYIKNISTFFLENKSFIKNINQYDENRIKEQLINIKGVGNWTIDMFLIFSLGHSNIAPKGDLGFNKAISKLYNKKLPISDRYLDNLYKLWSPYNSMATWYLWRSLDPIPVSY